MLSWQSRGTLQGKNIAIADGDSIAILCCHKETNVIQGIVYRPEAGNNMQELVMALDRVKIVTLHFIQHHKLQETFFSGGGENSLVYIGKIPRKNLS